MKLLAELTEAFAPPGFEDEIRDICRRELEPLVDSIRVDAMGNLIALKKGRIEGEGARKKIMLAGHMDEIGFLVRYVDDDGFLRLNPAGGFDPKTLIAKRVVVKGKSGKLVGLIGTKPIHIMKDDEKSKMPTLDDLFVDLGLPAETVKEEVEVGTPVTLWQRFESWGDVATCKAMDNRVSMWTIIRALQRAPAPAHDVYAVMTAQEEIGIRGATVAAYGVEPRHRHRRRHHARLRRPGRGQEGPHHDARQGRGDQGDGLGLDLAPRPGTTPARDRRPSTGSPTSSRSSRAAAPTPGASRWPGRESRRSTLSVPTRYVHSVVEMLNIHDLEATADLLARFLESEQPL